MQQMHKARRNFVRAICGFERELSSFEYICIPENRLKEILFFSLFVGCNDNDVVKGDFADKATLKYGTPIILALYLANVGVQDAGALKCNIAWSLRVSHRGSRYVNSLLISDY